MGSVELNEHHFNHNLSQQFDQQHMHQASHLKHQQLMSNIFKRDLGNRAAAAAAAAAGLIKEQDYEYHKDVDIKPYNHLIHHDDHSKDPEFHSDNVDNNESTPNDCNDSVYDTDTEMLNNNNRNNAVMGENLSMSVASKKTINDSHYCHLSQ